MQNFMNYRSVLLSEAPLPIQDGAKFYIEPDQASFDVLSVVYNVGDAKKTPWVVVAMPYWTRSVDTRTGEIEVLFHFGVNVLALDGHGQDNVCPIKCYALFDQQPAVPQKIIDWIQSL